MQRNLVSCRDLKAGMRVTRRVVCGDFLLAEEGAVLTQPLINLLSFLGVRRVAVDKTMGPESRDALMGSSGNPRAGKLSMS